jgi:hypothetical protein
MNTIFRILRYILLSCPTPGFLSPAPAAVTEALRFRITSRLDGWTKEGMMVSDERRRERRTELILKRAIVTA